MNKAEFQRAYKIATSDHDLSDADDSSLFGFGLPDFQPVATTIEAAAKTIRWQCVQLNGGIDTVALDECRQLFRRRVQIVN